MKRKDSEEGRERSERRSVSEGKCGKAGAGERVHSRDYATRLGLGGVSNREERQSAVRGRQGLLAYSIYMGGMLRLLALGAVVISEPEGNNATGGVAQMNRKHVKLL